MTDARPGIRRIRSGRGFRYCGPDGSRVTDAGTLGRIRALAVPPAWTDVWICPSPNGHLQATGRDAKGRKQFRYHPDWRSVRDEAKYQRLLAFGEALPEIRARVDRDLKREGLPQEKVLAVVVRLLESTFIRIGNDEYARANRSFGLTTLRDRHVAIEGSSIRFRFRAKSGKVQEISLRDRRLARLVKRCQELPGQELFQYLDADGQPQSIDSGDVNSYLREITGQDFTAKDFRTWAGTVLAYRALREQAPAGSDRETKHRLAEAVREVAGRLGNTAAVARRSYVHPAVLDAYVEGEVGEALVDAAADQAPAPLAASPLEPDEERQVLVLLRKRAERA